MGGVGAVCGVRVYVCGVYDASDDNGGYVDVMLAILMSTMMALMVMSM